MAKRRDYSSLVGNKFGRWTILEVFREGIYAKAKCLCDCGKVGEAVRISTLEYGESQSCGCLASEMAREKKRTHGYSRHPLYQTHYDMLRRCYDTSRKDFNHYGGRGIEVCDRWKEPEGKGFENFLKDSEKFTGEGNEIDRIDVNGNYCPENCKWATRKQQTRNTRFNRVVEYDGETRCLAEWAEDLKIPYQILQERLNKLGWSVEKAFTCPFRPKRLVLFRGSDEFEVKCVFKTPPNQFTRAKNMGLTFYQFFATLFGEEFKVKAYMGQEWCEIEPTEHTLGDFNLNLKPGFEQYCRDNGLTIGGRLK